MGNGNWQEKDLRRKGRELKERRERVKISLTDRVFGLLEGPIATTLVKLVATGLICGTTIALTGILAATSASAGLLMSTVGLGLVTTGIIWIFGGWKRQSTSAIENSDFEEELTKQRAKLADLEERLGNVEIIERFEDRLADRISQTSRDETDRPAETTYGSPEMDER